MTELSPQAKAVWDAYELVDCDPYKIDPRKAGLSAALEAAADQVVPEHKPWLRTSGRAAARHDVRLELLAIAAELRGTTPTETNGKA